ncbi:hypothetical protein Cgig2_012687 [Carnegiea gigantea]|uniref:Uncharacterized protein n=1 Tax=Carnegiea gigantea TaxID=171969 RepID=A0A9Q1QA07_9CARY|nr:hypothetical protein Cgig2_012687 [Carnegiea gigantea]
MEHMRMHWPHVVVARKPTLMGLEWTMLAIKSDSEDNSELKPGATKVEYGSSGSQVKFKWTYWTLMNKGATLVMVFYCDLCESTSIATSFGISWKSGCREFKGLGFWREASMRPGHLRRGIMVVSKWHGENNALIDIGFSGPKFTWVRGLSPETRKSARLD